MVLVFKCPVAIVTGARGQGGSYLCELLVEKDYHVKFLVRRSTMKY